MLITRRRVVIWALFFLTLVGCAPFLVHQFNERYGEPNPKRYDVSEIPVSAAPEYWKDVRPVLEQRCVMCHGCYDAPCQLKLTSWEGIVRGASADQIYGQRLFEAPMTRLHIDAQLASQWREKNFHPVLNERNNTPEANLQGSVMYRLLDLKRQQPQTTPAILDNKVFDFSLNRQQQCTTIEKIDQFEQQYSQWGMPYGMPSLSETDFLTLKKWLTIGAPSDAASSIASDSKRQVAIWESFFNGASLKQKLVSRYIYEHLFLAHIYFNELKIDDYGNRQFYRLVRSSTPPGTPIAELVSRRPYDDPLVPFWYRFKLDTETILEKTHMPYQLNMARMKKWEKWFLNNTYQVSELPSYESKVASNPFIAFQALPIKSRYRFLLDEAQFVVDTFIKGPVCRGQIALGVIDEHFWVFFVNPDAVSVEDLGNFLAKESDNLYLPSSDGSNGHLIDWLKYSSMQKKYLKAKMERIKEVTTQKTSIDLSLIWSGNQQNDAAGLTIFRHTDNATVVKGLVGQPPKTAWVLSYPLLERIYYLLVAGFDIYGNASHQLNTRLYMDFLRMEGESNFLLFLPEKDRARVRDYWYRGASREVKNYLYESHAAYNVESSVAYKTNEQQAELYGLLQHRLQPALSDAYQLTQISNKAVRQHLVALQQVKGAALTWFPQNSILRIQAKNQPFIYTTLINNLGYSNISELFDDQERRRPQEDYLTVVPGVLGAYPNAFFDVDVNELPEFKHQLANLKSEADYQVLANQYAVRRTYPRFWAFSDELQRYIKTHEPIAGGILDYNRFENR